MSVNLSSRILIGTIVSATLVPNAVAQSFSGLYSMPLIGNISAAPLILLTMQRDSRLFVEAYDDASDLNGDGIMDTKYNPALYEYDSKNKTYTSKILDYYGYFDSYKCYEYKEYKYGSGGSAGSIFAFVPIGNTDTGTKKCTNYAADKDSSGLTKPWSGDFLNYMTTTRIDALRKVMYGGKRIVDLGYVSGKKTSQTVLERAYIPQDLHAFGKEYTSKAVDGYDIADYTPLSQPASGKRHLFANVTLGKSSAKNPPIFRILQDRTERAWDWIAAEVAAVADKPLNGDNTISPTNLNVRVVVCENDQLPENGPDANGYCKTYNQSTKPTGILHDYGEDNSVYFGLLTGSSAKNFSGGVLRKAISTFTNEVDSSSGLFKSGANGIVYTIDNLRVEPFEGPGWGAYSSKTGDQSSAVAVGNPIAEMMYEGLRYLAGAGRTKAYWDSTTPANGTLSTNESPSLPVVLNWSNPYGSGGFNLCAKPTQMVISDVNPTYDSDQLPGSTWAGTSFTDTFGPTGNQLNVSTLADSIWKAEGLDVSSGGNIIIGEKYGGSDSGLPTTKTGVTSFSLIRGLVPEDPMWQGSYYAAAVAKYGRENDLKTLGNSAFASSKITNRTVNTSVVALSSTLPRIQVPVTLGGTSTTVTVVPFAQTNSGGTWKFAEFSKLFVDNIKNVPGATTDASINGGSPYYKLQVVFSDSSLYPSNAHDNDMDARATYEVYWDDSVKQIVVNVCADPFPAGQTSGGLTSANQTVRCDKDGVDGVGYSATGTNGMHLGYFISGVIIPSGEQPTRLVVRNNAYDTGAAQNTDLAHTLDLASARIPGTFVDNYYNSSSKTLTGLLTYHTAADGASLRLNHSASYAVSASAAGQYIPHDPLWYAAKYGGYKDTPSNWAGDDGVTPSSYFKVVNPALLKEQIHNAILPNLINGSSFAATASNSTDLKTLTAVYQGKYIAKYWSGRLSAYSINTTAGTVDTSSSLWDASSSIPTPTSRNIFTYRLESAAGIPFKWTSLNSNEQAKLSNQQKLLDYIRGVRTNEGTTSTSLRVRDSDTVLGDIVNSQPVYAGADDQGYSSLSGTEGSKYSAYVTTKASRTPMIYVGANDGMLHGFRASDGVEMFAYIPRATLWGDNASLLSSLTQRTYTHKYYVDGPVVVNDYYDGSNWKTALIGTMGAGGKSIFALDVTTPDSFSDGSVMWEFSHPELGYVRNPPVIARLNDGNWYVITGNGFESITCDSTASPRYTSTSSSSPRPNCSTNLTDTARNAKLFIIKLKPDLTDGWTLGSDYFVLHATDIQTATTPPSVTMSGEEVVSYSNGSDNGLAGPATIDHSTTGVKYVYAGDLQGNVWKFDLTEADPSKWTTTFKLFQAKDPDGNTQPITSSLAAGVHPTDSSKTCVSAGTGRFVYDGDLVYKGIQSAYGVIDAGSALAGPDRTDDLQQYTITAKTTETIGSKTWNLVYVSDKAFDTSKNGWFVDLREPSSVTPRDIGERIVQAPIQTKLRSGELMATFTTSIPTADNCEATGKSYTLDFNACTGEALSVATFDLNGDNSFTNPDKGNPGTGSRLSGAQIGGATGGFSSPAMCFESATGGVKGCSFDLGILSCTDGRIETIKKPPTSLKCGVRRTSWRQLR